MGWMGDRLWAGKPSRYVTSHLGQLSLPSLWGIGKSSIGLGLRRGVFTCFWWKVTLCALIWQVTPFSSEMEFHEQLCTRPFRPLI